VTDYHAISRHDGRREQRGESGRGNNYKAGTEKHFSTPRY